MIDTTYTVLTLYEIFEFYDLTLPEQSALKFALTERDGRLRDGRAYPALDVEPVISAIRRPPLDIEPTKQSLLAPLRVISLANATEIYSLSDDECEWIRVYLAGRTRRLVNGSIGYFVGDIEHALARVRV